MARSVEAARGFYVRQRDQGFVDSIPTQSVGITQLKDEVRFGLMPIGTIFPVMANISGAYNPPPSGVVQDGFMRADGAAIPSGMALSGNVPDMTGSRFLMGTNGSGAGNNPLSGASGGNLNNEKSLAVPELPGHVHGQGSYAGSFTGTVGGSTGPHDHPGSTAAGQSYSANSTVQATRMGSTRTVFIEGSPGATGYGIWTSTAGGSAPADNTFLRDATPGFSMFASISHTHGPSSVTVSPAPDVPAGTLAVTNTAVSITGTSGPAGSGDSFSILPQYVATVYLIRVK